jgi:serine/threonine-protein kinase
MVMAEAYSVFASYLRFKEVLSDPLGHLYRAGKFDASGVQRAVWLRVFDRPLIEAEDVIAGFDRARAIGEAVQSTNVASGVDCLVDDGTPAIAADFVASQPLSRVLDRVSKEQFPIPVDNALLISEKIALALSAALTAEIDGERVVHGFLHPSLVFVTNDGEGIVSGFGVAEQLLTLIEDQSSIDLIHPYLAPEVLQSRAASRRGDVYSLGAILFHLLTGKPLPTATEDRASAIAGATMAYDEESVPGDIKALLQRALAQHPEERFSSASDLKKELDRLLYGGAYSPTTFNLALFMDRLFRPEIEADEADLARELATNVRPYLAPIVTPDPVFEATESARPSALEGRGLWLGLGVAGAAAVAATLWLTVFRGPSTPPPPPTPTAEEVAAERQAQDEKMRELAEGLVAEMMAQKEEEIRGELLARQAKIDELQQRLVESERRAQQGQVTGEDLRKREELQRQIAAEEETQRQREAELEAERLQAAEEAKQQARAQQTATAAVEAVALVAAATVASSTPTLVPASVPTAIPTVAPTPQPTAVVQAGPAVQENSFVDPTEVDIPPAVIKKAPVVWSRAAIHSRREGVVVLQATVNADGLVDEVKILRADHEGFGSPQAVMEAVMKYRFKPGSKDGVPITTHYSIVARYDFTGR